MATASFSPTLEGSDRLNVAVRDTSAVALYFANLIDMVFTAYWIVAWGIAESNPIMAAMWEADPVVFICYKVFVVGLFVRVIVRHSHRAWHTTALAVMAVVYGMVVCYHISFMLFV